MMRKSILLAALAATLLVTSSVTWGADNTGTMQNVVAAAATPVVRTTADDVLPGGTTVAIDAASAITGAAGGVTASAGGSATYTVDATHTLSADTGTTSLTLTGGTGGGASDDVAGGNAELVNNGTVSFGTGSTLTLTVGAGGAESAGGNATITNNNLSTIIFDAGSTFVKTTVTPGTKPSGVANIANAGTLQVDVSITGFTDLLSVVDNTGAVTISGTHKTGTVGAVTMTGGSGRVYIDVAGSSVGSFGNFNAGGNILFISPSTSSSSNNLTFGAVEGAGITIEEGAFVSIASAATTTTSGDIRIGDNATVAFGADVTSAGELVIGSGATVDVTGATSTTGDISIADNANVTLTGTVATTTNGNLTIGKNVNATFGDTVGLNGTGEFSVGQDSTVTATGAVTADKITITGADVTFTAGTLGAANGTTISNGSYVTIGNATLAGNVTVDSSTLITTATGSGIGGNLTTAGNSVIDIHGDGAGAAYDLGVGGTTTLSAGTRFAIDSATVTGTGDKVLLTSAGALDAAAWLAANAGITGSANQIYTFAITGGNTITAKGYDTIATYNQQSRTNITNRMTALGVNNAGSLVDDSFGSALFDVARGVDDGNSSNDTVPGILKAVFDAKDTQAYKNAETTWTILRTFAGVTGGGPGSPIEANSAASAMTGQNQAASVSSMISIANNNISAVNSRIAANNVARAKVGEMVGSDAALASAMLNCNFANRFWVGGLGMWENAGSRDGSNGYKLDTWGLMTGYDHVFGPVTVGGSFGYSRGTFEEKDVLSNDSKINNYAFNLYATYNHRSGFFASILGGYAYSDVALRRNMVGGYEASDYHVNTWNIGTNIGYDWRPMQNLTVTPRVGLYYIYAKSNTISGNYTSITGIKDHATQLPIDLSVTYRIPMANGGLDLTARGGYAYNFNNNGADGILTYNNIVGVAPVSIKGRTPGHHTWNVGGGVKYQAGRFDVGVNYDYYTKSSYHAHRVTGVVGVSF